MLARLLGSSSTSLLYQSLVVRQKLATAAGSDYGASRRGPSSFYLYASPRPGVGIGRLEKAVDDELAKILEKGVSKNDVEAAKQQLQDMAIFARDSLRTGANAIATALMAGRTVQDVEAWPAPDRRGHGRPGQRRGPPCPANRASRSPPCCCLKSLPGTEKAGVQKQ